MVDLCSAAKERNNFMHEVKSPVTLRAAADVVAADPREFLRVFLGRVGAATSVI